ncbi:iron-sulfur cluster assembly protein [Nocardioides sp. WL0053]|uniref:Iron-sulfur cluster assembly protein n=1 Tax=Nocardioides jiangsuensis TaxID=2866161 RepID=A0ABS7RQ34_9ACTN|nr:iron-sulfur cluster assembly protein [Nocardioides jiangsuensis]MBY9076030.1 iron-sulfur cluster assembly protein [Nocardioides jiangsuensis]
MTTATGMTSLEDRVRAALGTVRDPELDESITDLDFVASVTVGDVGDVGSGATVGGGGEVVVELRLPTYFCAPNFAYLMVADAHDAVSAVAGVGPVTIRLLDHFASDEINAGVAGGRGFSGSFPGLADDELHELRVTFQRKAHQACQERVASRVVRSGRPLEDLAGLTLGDAAPGPELDRLRRRRADLGLPADDAAPLLLGPDGTPVTAPDLVTQLRLAKTTRISIEGNAGLCRGLLGVRYGLGRETG